ncbi:hypothetical protein D3C86_1485550 [compost metagenome]
MRQRLPLGVMSREMWSSSAMAGSIPSASSQAAMGAATGSSLKVASRRARAAPARMVSGPALPPRMALTASMMMDLPAPVSPVSTQVQGFDQDEILDSQALQHGATSIMGDRPIVPSATPPKTRAKCTRNDF